MTTNGHGAWKNTLIGILTATILAGGGVWWTFAAGEQSYFAERRALIDSIERLTRISDRLEERVTSNQVGLTAHTTSLSDITRRLERLERKVFGP